MQVKDCLGVRRRCRPRGGTLAVARPFLDSPPIVCARPVGAAVEPRGPEARSQPIVLAADILDAAPPWAVTAGLLSLGVVAALLLHAALYRLFDRLVRNAGLFRRALVQRTRRLSRLVLVLTGLWIAAANAPLDDGTRTFLRHLGAIGVVVVIGWIALTILHVGSIVYMRRFKTDVEDNLVARKHVTQIRILKGAISTLIVILTLAAALMTLPGVRQIGVSLLASAGAAGIIAGLALQPLLTNLIAGVQIALTQPIRIDDAVLVEGEFGWVEEIGSTYVVVRLWDWRRMILPLTYFIQKPFQNWTREKAELIGTVMLYLDYSAPVGAIRERAEAIVRDSPLWDGKVVNVAVVETSERSMHVRVLASARNAGVVFDLRAEVREKLLEWLREEYPDALPRDRLAVDRIEAAPAAIN